MPSHEADIDIPYLATAQAITEADRSPDLFLESLFPDVTPEQRELFKLYTVGKLLDGIHYGIEMCGHDPIGQVEAYERGVTDGLEFRANP